MRLNVALRIVLCVAAALVYTAALSLFVGRLGPAISALGALPIFAVGLLFGVRAGFGMGLAFVPANLALLAAAGLPDRSIALEVPGYVAVALTGGAAGALRDLGGRLTRLTAEETQRTAMREVLSTAPLFIAVTSGPAHRIAYVNEQTAAALGHADVIGRPIGEVVECDDPSVLDALGRTYAEGTPFERRETIIRLLGRDLGGYVDLRFRPARAASGAIDGVVLFASDVNASVSARRAIAARARQQAALATMGQRALSGEPIGTLAGAACEVARRILSIDLVELDEPVPGIEDLRTMASAGSDGDGRECVALSRRALFTQETSVLAQASDGRWIPVAHEDGEARGRGVAVAVRGVGRVFGVLSAFSHAPRVFAADEVFFLSSLANVVAGAMDRRARELELEHQALYDPLTGLPNRRLLHDRLQQAIAEAKRRDTDAALFVIDLDRFKLVNDAHGHDVGDLLLEQVAQRLRSVTRESDTVARLGGDEFAIVASAPGTPAELDDLAERVLGAFVEPFHVGLQLRVTASLGIAVTPADGLDARTLMRRADMAMYSAKRESIGSRRFTADLDQDAREQLTLASDLRAALDQQTLDLVFQPKVELATGRAVGVEALARWRHPQLGAILPERFVPAAEQNGLIDELTRWVVDAAAAQCSRWRAGGHDLGVAVNVSMRNLRDGALGEHIAELMAAHDCPHDLLTLEITESATAGDLPEVAARLRSLRELGVRLSIDDYGTAYSSLQHVRRLPVQEVKIDRSFVVDLLANASSAAIVRSTIDLAHSLGLTVVAEGVETREVWDRLRELGCDVAQGYFIAPPLTPEEFDAWIAMRSTAFAA